MNAFNMSRVDRRVIASGPFGPTMDRWNFTDIVGMLIRRMKSIVLILLIAMAAAAIYLITAQSKYTATASLLPELKRNPAAPSEVPQESLIDPAIVENQIETIRSKAIALLVIDKLSLSDDPELIGSGSGPLARLLNGLRPAQPDGDGRDRQREAAAVGFGRKLTVSRLGRSYVAEISFTSADPVKAAAIANEVTNAYIQSQLDANLAAEKRSKQWMQRRLAELAQDSEAAKKNLEDYKAANNLDLDANGQPAVIQEEERLESSRTAAKTAASDLKDRHERLQSALQGEDSNTVPPPDFFERIGDAKLSALHDAYSKSLSDDREPSLGEAGRDAAMADQRNAIWRAIHDLEGRTGTELGAARVRTAAIERRIDELAPQLEAARSYMADLEQLTGKYQDSLQLRNSLRNRFARVSDFLQQQSLPVTEARVISKATPPLTRSSPKATLVLLLAACAGCLIGTTRALAAEYFDRRVRRAEQIEGELGMRSLGSIPRSRLRLWAPRPVLKKTSDAKNGGTRLSRHVDGWLAGPAGETLRYVRAVLDEQSRVRSEPSARILAVVSPKTGEGKTVVALGIAAVAARSGKQVLLIDADVHDPSLTRAFVPEEPDSSDVTRGFDVDNIRDFGLGLQFITLSGSRHRYPSELLGSDAMRDLLDRARDQYDYIIVDTPSLTSHVDVFAAAGLFDAFVVTVEWGHTTLDDIAGALTRSSLLRERILGVLINKSPQAGRRAA